ncbi:MAG TPA: FemAB family XrtA/PEP-CTERM system-associated protein [Rhizomicrobium sp.]|nr:FemAB family XrtA/PEP-CTERM system-associated protein [Rhizomicrobium sp.]
MTVSLLESGEETAWDEYVLENPSGTFFHLSGWKPVIEKAFGHRTYYLVARERGAIQGVLPLTHVKSALFGSSLISNAFCVRGGVVSHTADAETALRQHATALAKSLKVGCIEFRSTTTETTWTVKSGVHANFRRPIEGDDDRNLKAIPRKQRAVLRKAIAAGLRSEIDSDATRLHDIYARSVRRLGTPVFSRRYFQLLKGQFENQADVVTVIASGKPIAAVMNFYFRDEVLPYYGGGLEEARHIGGNDFLYWEVMRRAAERGCRVFDFGRSKIGTGSHDYKRNWGFEPEPLVYEYLPFDKEGIPDLNPLNPKYRLAIELWRRLPLPITKLVGPAIVRGIG